MIFGLTAEENIEELTVMCRWSAAQGIAHREINLRIISSSYA